MCHHLSFKLLAGFKQKYLCRDERTEGSSLFFSKAISEYLGYCQFMVEKLIWESSRTHGNIFCGSFIFYCWHLVLEKGGRGIKGRILHELFSSVVYWAVVFYLGVLAFPENWFCMWNAVAVLVIDMPREMSFFWKLWAASPFVVPRNGYLEIRKKTKQNPTKKKAASANWHGRYMKYPD